MENDIGQKSRQGMFKLLKSIGYLHRSAKQLVMDCITRGVLAQCID
jgi:hypothetical protein